MQYPSLFHNLTSLSILEETRWFPLLLYLMHVTDDVCPSSTSNSSKDTVCLVLFLCLRTDFDVIVHNLISFEFPQVASLYWRIKGFSAAIKTYYLNFITNNWIILWTITIKKHCRMVLFINRFLVNEMIIISLPNEDLLSISDANDNHILIFFFY